MDKEKYLKDGERAVDLQRSNLWLIQDPGRFCFGVDAVLLSAFCEIKAGERCLDMGTGTGILPLLLSAKTDATELVGLEIQPESADMARRSVEMNIALRAEVRKMEGASGGSDPAGSGSTESRPVEGRVRIEQGDLKEASTLFGRSRFDVVTCNPPYMTGGHGIVNPADAKAIARHEILCTLEDVAREAAAVLVPGGRLYMVHRPFRLAELITTMTRYGLEPKRLRLVYPRSDREPNLVLLGCVRGGHSELRVEKPLILADENGETTEEVKELYGF
ncbi:MAG: tRNA1(Val) (adenine(37)-N6)-methyltransferase [Lachnospiraceae bacterium]|nr:tRNA1(Val) (adenine(37)-N6)-methyltransferase [Lachnospiraceae bacterium]MBR6018618.1 tRNA1(Val) (adenine(37)-N6)-methyltransferase [Lachnospiraceae bacterium]